MRTSFGAPEEFTTVRKPRMVAWPPRKGQLIPQYCEPTEFVGSSSVPSLE